MVSDWLSLWPVCPTSPGLALRLYLWSQRRRRKVQKQQWKAKELLSMTNGSLGVHRKNFQLFVLLASAPTLLVGVDKLFGPYCTAPPSELLVYVRRNRIDAWHPSFGSKKNFFLVLDESCWAWSQNGGFVVGWYESKEQKKELNKQRRNARSRPPIM